MFRAGLIGMMLLWASCAAALELSLPVGAQLVSDRGSALDSYAVPVAPWRTGRVETLTVEGRVDRQSWRIESGAITSLQLLDPLRAQVLDAGYDTLFACTAADCGGFDFRFAIEVIPAPDMHVDIRDYRFLAARKGEAVVSLLVSRTRTAAYVQIIQVNPSQAPGLAVVRSADAQQVPPPDTQAEPQGTRELATRLREDGHVALTDLSFGSGTAELSTGSYASLSQVAAFLEENPNAQIALVGHTDATGALDLNIALSRQRAQAVRDRLIASYAIAEDRLRAEGMGYLAPRATNLTQAGREQNRRVEAILLRLD